MMEGALEETVDEQTEDETDAEELTDQEWLKDQFIKIETNTNI